MDANDTPAPASARITATIRLDPSQFRALDVLARTVGGRPLEVVDVEKMRGCFARTSEMAGDVVIDTAVNEADWTFTNEGIIQIANRIDCAEFWSCPRPEMNYSCVPQTQICEFLVLHEIAHKRCDFFGFDVIRAFHPSDPDSMRLPFTANEVRADRYAWNAISDGAPLPRLPDAAERVTMLEDFISRHVDRFPAEPRPVQPLTTEQGKMVPVSHVRYGIPWADRAT